MNRLVTAVLVGFLLLSGCGKKERLSEKNLAEIYTSASDAPEPKFIVYHRTDNKSDIHFKIDNRTIAYVPAHNNKEIARVRMSWQLFNEFESKEMIDSSSFNLIDTIGYADMHQLIGSFEINAQRPQQYVLKVTTSDINRGTEVISFVQIYKDDEENRQNFKVILLENNALLFRNYIYADEKVKIIYNKKKKAQKLYGHYFDHIFAVAPPPFSTYSPKPFNYEDNEHFLLELDKNGEVVFTATKNGFYHFTLSEGSKKGLTLFQFGDDFPEINQADEMLASIRFILTKKEYKKFKGYNDPKKALDEFWLNTTHDPERARQLIKTYYHRVENANYFFSSYKEGWKTDRGIIYIVFGPPDVVYRSTFGESWVYGEEKNYRSVNFNFSRVINPFTANDYLLTRSTIYKNPWYRSVDAWRQGRVSSLNY